MQRKKKESSSSSSSSSDSIDDTASTTVATYTNISSPEKKQYQNLILATLWQDSQVKLPQVGGNLLDDRGYIIYSMKSLQKPTDKPQVVNAPHPFLSGLLQVNSGWNPADGDADNVSYHLAFDNDVFFDSLVAHADSQMFAQSLLNNKQGGMLYQVLAKTGPRAKLARYFTFMAWHLSYPCSAHYKRKSNVPWLPPIIAQSSIRHTADEA